MKILEIKPNEKFDFNTIIETTDDVIRVSIPSDITDEYELCTVITIDGNDYPDFDDTEDAQTLELFMQLRDTLNMMGDTSAFGSEENYINCMDIIDTMIEDLMAVSMVDDPSDYQADSEDNLIDDSNEEEEPALRIITTTGDVYHTPYASVNWQHNAEHVDSIEEAMCTFQTMVAEMYAGKTSVEDVTDTAESVLNNMSVNTEYEFPMTRDVTKREMATIKMFDAFAAYAVIYAQSLMHREKINCFNTLNDMVNFTKHFVHEFKNADSDTERKAAIEGVEAFLEGFSFIDESEDEVDDEAIADVMEAANDIEGGDAE